MQPPGVKRCKCFQIADADSDVDADADADAGTTKDCGAAMASCPESGNWLMRVDLSPRWAGRLNFVCCFCLCLARSGWHDHVDPGLLVVGLVAGKAGWNGNSKESFVKVIVLVGCLAKGNNGSFQLGFAIRS
jgi:hypothetical protein